MTKDYQSNLALINNIIIIKEIKIIFNIQVACRKDLSLAFNLAK